MLFADGSPDTSGADAKLLAVGAIITTVAHAIAYAVSKLRQSRVAATTAKQETDTKVAAALADLEAKRTAAEDTTKDGVIKDLRQILKDRSKEWADERKALQAEMASVRREMNEIRMAHEKCQTDQSAIATELRLVKGENDSIKKQLEAIQKKQSGGGGP